MTEGRFVGVNRWGEARIGHGQGCVLLEVEGPPDHRASVILAPETARFLAAGLRERAGRAEGDERPTRALPRERTQWSP